mmetsp:Transcript_48085/g.112406  ORF Transcript_48085/g.112406 Transcript_48085/m.112406 type:complete len:2061 (+) Transcript_48085:91-6273(+)
MRRWRHLVWFLIWEWQLSFNAGNATSVGGIPFLLFNTGSATSRNHHTGAIYTEEANGQWCGGEWSTTRKDLGALDIAACANATEQDRTCRPLFFHIVNGSSGLGNETTCGCVLRAQECIPEGPQTGIEAGIYSLPLQAMFRQREGTSAGFYCNNTNAELQVLTGLANKSSNLCADFVQENGNCSDVFHFINTTGVHECACILLNNTCSAADGSGSDWQGNIYTIIEHVGTISFGAILPLDFAREDVTRGQEVLRNQSEAVLMALRAVTQSVGFDGFDLGNRRRPVELLLAGVNAGESAAEATEFLLEKNITFLIAPSEPDQAEEMAAIVSNWTEDVLLIAPMDTSRSLTLGRERVFGLEVNWTALWDPTFASLSAALQALDGVAADCNLISDDGGLPKAVAIMYEEAFEEMCLGAAAMARAWGIDVPLWFPVTLANASAALDVISNQTQFGDDARNSTASAVIACVEEPLCTTVVESINSTGALVLPLCAAQKQTIDTDGADWFMTSAATFWTWDGDKADGLTGWNMTKFVTLSGTDPSLHGLAALTAFTSVMHAIQETSSLDPLVVGKYMSEMSYQSFFGTLQFDENRTFSVPATLVQHLEIGVAYPTVLRIPNSSVSAANSTDTLAFPVASKDVLPCYIGGAFGFIDDDCVECESPLVPRPIDAELNIACTTGSLLKLQLCSSCPPSERYMQTLDSVTTHPLCTFIEGCPFGQEGVALIPRSSGIAQGNTLECSNCSAGRFELYGTCNACPLGRFAAKQGSTACQACAAGWFAPETGQSSCDGCPGGTTSVSGSFTCMTCQAGSISLPNSSTCSRCEAGFVARVDGLTACELCEYGRFSVWEANECKECPQGSYQYLGGQSLCLSITHAMIVSQNVSFGTNRQRYWTRYDNGSLSREGCRFTPKACESYERCTTGTTGVHCAQCIPGYSIRKFSAVEEDSPCFECQAAWWNISITILAILGRALCAVLLASVSISILSHPSCVILPLSRLGLLYIAYLGAFLFCFLQVFEERMAGETSTLFPALATYFAAAMLNGCYGMPFLETEVWSIKCLIQTDLPDLTQKLMQVRSIDWFTSENAANIEALQDEARYVQLVFTIVMGLWPLVVSLVAYLGCFIAFSLYLRRWREFYKNSLVFYEDLQEHGFYETLNLKTEDGEQKWEEGLWTAYLHEYSYRWILWRPLDHVENYHKKRGWMHVKFKRFTRDSWPVFVATLLLSYNSVLLGVIESLQCITLGADSNPKIRSNSILHCLDWEEELYLNVVGLVGLFWWGILFPAIIIRFLRRRRNKLSSEVGMRRWGMLIDGLQYRCYWWEAYIFGTKLCLTLIVFLTPQYSGRNKNLFLLCWSIAYAFILSIFMPHDDRCHNVLMDLDARFVKIWVLSCLFLEMESLFSNEVSTFCLVFATAALHLWFLFAAIRLFLEHTIIALAVSPDFHMILEHNERALATGYRLRAWVVLLQKIVLRTHRWLQKKSAYVSVDPLSCWVTISGSRADIAKPPTVIRGADVQPNIPEMAEAPTVPLEPHVKVATRQQREQLVRVLSRTMAHVALSCKNATFSISLLEFVVRAGFWQACLHQHGYTRHKVHLPDSKHELPREVSKSSHNVAVQIDDRDVAGLLDIDHHTPGAYVLACERPKRRYALWAHLRAVSAAQPGQLDEVMKGGPTPANIRQQLMQMEAMVARTMYEDRAEEVIEQLCSHGVIDQDADYDNHLAMTMINADKAWAADRMALLRQVLGLPVVRQKLKEKRERMKQVAKEMGLPKNMRQASQASVASRGTVASKKQGFSARKKTSAIEDVELDAEAKMDTLQDMFTVETFKHGIGLDDLQVALMDLQRMPSEELSKWLDLFEQAWLRHNRVTAYNMRYFTKQVCNEGVLTGTDLLPVEGRRLWREEKRSREVEASISTYMGMLPDPDAAPPVVERSTQAPSVRGVQNLPPTVPHLTKLAERARAKQKMIEDGDNKAPSVPAVQNLQRVPLLWARMVIALCGGFWRFKISHLTKLAGQRVKVRQKMIEDEHNKEKRLCEVETATRHEIEESVVELRSQFDRLCLELRSLPSEDGS